MEPIYETDKIQAVVLLHLQARKYGVRSAMPGFIALKLCPQLVFVKPDFQKYQK